MYKDEQKRQFQPVKILQRDNRKIGPFSPTAKKKVMISRRRKLVGLWVLNPIFLKLSFNFFGNIFLLLPFLGKVIQI